MGARTHSGERQRKNKRFAKHRLKVLRRRRKLVHKQRGGQRRNAKIYERTTSA